MFAHARYAGSRRGKESVRRRESESLMEQYFESKLTAELSRVVRKKGLEERTG